MSERNYILSGFKWITGGVVAQLLIRTVILAVLARIISPEDFGIVALALIIIGLAEMLILRGPSAALIQLETIDSFHIGTLTWLLFAAGFFLFFLITWLSPNIALFFNEPRSQLPIQVISVSLLINALGQPSQRLLLRHMRFKESALIEIVSYIIGYGMVGIIMGILDFAVWALVGAYVTQILLLNILSGWMVRSQLSIKFSSDALKAILQLGSGFTLLQVLDYLGKRSDRFFIGKYISVGDLGLYTRAIEFINRISLSMEKIITQVMFTSFSRMQNDVRLATKEYLRLNSAASIVTMPAVSIVFLFHTEIIILLFGDQWLDSAKALQILAPVVFLQVLSKSSITLINGFGRPYIAGRSYLLFCFSAILGSFIGVSYGIQGISYAVVVASILQLISLVAAVRYLIHVSFYSLIKSICVGLPISIIIFVLGMVFKLGLISGGSFEQYAFFTVGVVVVFTLIYIFPKFFIGDVGIKLIQRVWNREKKN